VTTEPWSSRRLLTAVVLIACAGASALAQAPAVRSPAAANQTPAAPATVPAPQQVPSDYVIGPDDVLTIFFWREKDLSGDVSVRPDGRISLPLINDVEASGLTPEQLRVRLTAAADKYIEEPTVTVVVKQINSRKVFITGQIAKPGAYAMMGPTTVLQLITMAGGVQEYADDKHIQILRTQNGRPISLRFNYDEVKKGKKLEQNIALIPGDTVIVP
jgi:polysaccharide biosynthesis/export protein